MNSYLISTIAVLLLSAAAVADDLPSYKIECIELNGTISFNVTYKKSDDKTSNYEVKLPKNATIAAHNCDQKVGPVMIKLRDAGSDLTIEFGINYDDKKKVDNMDPGHWGVSNITYEYGVTVADVKLPGARIASALGSFFDTPINKSYSCSKDSVKLVNVTTLVDGKTTNLTAEFVIMDETALAINIFPNHQPNNEYDYHYCKADQKVKDIVPIAVGVALAALVVIVLVAYLIGRRRTVAAGGYERV